MTELFRNLRRLLCRHKFALTIYFDQDCSLHRCKKCGREIYIDLSENYKTDTEESIRKIVANHCYYLNTTKEFLIENTKKLSEIGTTEDSLKAYYEKLKKETD